MKNVFIDSNIWIYALSDNDPEKHRIAADLLLNPIFRFYTSVQVINEVSFTLKRKFSADETFIKNLISSFYNRSTVLQFDRQQLIEACYLREKSSLNELTGTVSLNTKRT
jgi:predicted nucleic acid-binding protein